MKVVVDTNVLLSGIGWTGPSALILTALIDGRHQYVTTLDLLDEFARVLNYSRLRAVAAHPDLPLVVEWLHRPDHIVIPAQRLSVMTADPADNLVLEAAVAGRADAVVSGDRHLLNLRVFQEIPILPAGEFVEKYL